MIKRLIKNGALLSSGLLPFNFDLDPDKVLRTNKTAEAFYQRNNPNETGWDRLYLMFSMDEFHNFSPEVYATTQAGFMGMFIGACYGGFIRSRNAYLDFMERNQATAFTSHFDAKKKLQDAVTLSFAKGAFQWGWRLGLFTMSYVGVTTAISVYRGKSGILEYVAAGAVTGTVYKLPTGPRAMVVGGLLGAGLGSIAGCASYGLMKLTGMSMEETRYWQYQWKLDRESRVREIYKRHADTEKSELEKSHDETITKVEPEKYLDSIESSSNLSNKS